MDQNVTIPSTSKAKIRSSTKNVSGSKNLTVNNYNTMHPSTDFKLPAEIFASDDSVSDIGAGGMDDMSTFNEFGDSSVVSTSKDTMLGGINIKVENFTEPVSSSTGIMTKKSKENTMNLNLADIKTELQDEFDWNNMSLATVNNNPNLNKLQTM